MNVNFASIHLIRYGENNIFVFHRGAVVPVDVVKKLFSGDRPKQEKKEAIRLVGLLHR